MNRNTILALADYVEQLEEGQYDQIYWVHEVEGGRGRFDHLPPMPSSEAVIEAAEWCGTAACIAGHAQALSGQAEDWRDPDVMGRHDFDPEAPQTLDGWLDYITSIEDRNMDSVVPDAGDWLGLNEWEKHSLFCAAPEVPKAAYVESVDGGDRVSRIRPEHAAKVLRHLAETGLVDWMLGQPEEDED